MSKISVIIPVYNSAGSIREALNSVAAQTAFAQSTDAGTVPAGIRDPVSCEIIVVDDCSTDDTVEVVGSWRRGSGASSHVSGLRFQSSSLRLLKQATNSGPAAARNRGVAEAAGEWIAFLDADDLWFPEKLEIQLKLAEEHPQVAIWCSEVIMRYETNPQVNMDMRAVKPVTLDDFVTGNPVATSTVLAKKSVFASVGGFDESFRGSEDYDLWMRIAAGCNMARYELPLAIYRENVGSLSMDDRSFLPHVMRVIVKAFAKDGVFSGRSDAYSIPAYRTASIRAAISNQYWNASWMAFRRGARWTAIRHWAKAWFLNLVTTRRVRRDWFRLLLRYLVSKPTAQGFRFRGA